MRILLVEDDVMIGEAVNQALRDAAHVVDWVLNGKDALNFAAADGYDVILLDLGLPTVDGTVVLRQLRASNNATPIIVVTARDTLAEKINGLDTGADDYLVKPFAVGELLARIRALSRRGRGSAKSTVDNGKIELDTETKEAIFDARRFRLTNREYALLYALLKRPGAVLSRMQLEQQVYGWNDVVESNAIEFLIHSLRKKLGVDVIKNVRGLGWMVERQQ